MKRTNLFPVLTLVATLAVAPMTGWAKTSEPPRSMELQATKDAANTTEWLQNKVRHELVMLPYYSVFDHITYKVEGDRVELAGQVHRPTLEIECSSRRPTDRGRQLSDQQYRGAAAFT